MGDGRVWLRMEFTDDYLRRIASGAVHDLAEVQDPGTIERTEQDDGSVRYTDVLLLAPGVWGDAGSGRHIYYSPEGIENSADNWDDDTINLFHERENEIVDVGDVDTDEVFVDDEGNLYADLVFPRDNDASRLADDLLQQALETGGQEGIQGPSVELRGEDYRFNEDHGTHELVEGTFNGLGLVGLGVSPGPGSKDAAFAEQTQDRAVALAGTDDADLLTLQTNETMELDELIALLAEHGIQLGDDPDEETVHTLVDALELQDESEDDDEGGGGGDGDEGGDDEEGSEEGDGSDDDDDDDVDINLEEVATRVEEIGTTVAENSERIDAMAERFEDLDDGSSLSELFDTVSDVSKTLETLADAETVDDLESRLSEIEDTTEEATSLADVDGAELAESDEKYLVEMGPNATQKPAFTK